MFFALSKILGFFALPSNLLWALGLIGVLLLATRLARLGRWLTVTSLLLLGLAGLSPLGNALIVSLEDRFPAYDERAPAPDGIVVLGGAVTPEVSMVRGTAALTEAAERMTVAVELARRYPQARLIFSGGSGTLIAPEATEAEQGQRFFERMGLPRARIALEDRSRNTYQNAAFSKEVAAPKPNERWLLVTSAYHMPRAIGCFRRAGFAVIPHPVDFRTSGGADLALPFSSIADGLKRTDTAIREYVGMLVYWLTGRSSDLFPGPPRGCDTALDRCRP